MAEARILLADDDPAIRSAVAWLLKEQGYEVAAVPSHGGIFEQLERRRPDLLLLDIMMPEVDGVEVLQRMKADDRWRDIPVVMISAHAADDMAVRTLRLGANDFIAKPFKMKELVARVQAQLRMQASLDRAYSALQDASIQLADARDEARSRRELVDILHEVTGELSPEEIFRILARRVARALDISRCSVILARPGDEVGIVATAFDNPGLRNFPIRLDRYPEIRTALEHGEPVLVEDGTSSPLYSEMRKVWDAEGLTVPLKSAIALPFTLDRMHLGVFFLRTSGDEPPLSHHDIEFADAVIRAAVAAIQRAQLLETTDRKS